MSVIKNYLNKISLSKPIKYENMVIIPIKIQNIENLDFYTLKEAEAKSSIVISEVTESGSVNNLKIMNKSDKEVLILDGEELIGAKQNRSINISVLIAKRTEVVVPVSCVEAGRWRYESENFKSGDNFISSTIRRNRDLRVRESLKNYGNFQSNQGEVWSDIDDLSEDLNTESDTSAFHDTIKQNKSSIKDYVDNFPLFKDQSGLIVWINDELQGFESLYNYRTYKKFHKNIVQSYVLDAIARNIDFESKDIDYKKEAVEFLKLASESKEFKNKSISCGNEYSFINNNIRGSGLEFNGELLHTKIYYNEEKIQENEDIEWEQIRFD